MTTHSSFTPLPVAGIDRGSKRRYDPQAERKLIQACLAPGISLAGLALVHGINANLLGRRTGIPFDEWNARGMERLSSCRPAMREQFANTAHRLRWQRFEDILQIHVDVMAVKPCRVDQAHDGRGTLAGAIIHSLMLPCRARGVEPFMYLRHALTALPRRQPEDDITDLLPFHFARQLQAKAPKPHDLIAPALLGRRCQPDISGHRRPLY